MYLLREGSSTLDNGLFLKLPKTEKNYKNPQILFFPELSVATWFFESGIAEKSLIHWFTDNYVDPEKDFVDIGAHVGTYSWTCGKKAKHTHAFECNPKVFCYLASNIALHEMENDITPYRYGLGCQPGILTYYIRSADGGGNGFKKFSDKDDLRETRQIQVRTLDSFELNNIGCIKIDVEGFEKEVILGGLDTLKRNNYPPILFESWGEWKEKEDVPARVLKEELISTLKNIGYEIEGISGFPDMFIAKFKL